MIKKSEYITVITQKNKKDLSSLFLEFTDFLDAIFHVSDSLVHFREGSACFDRSDDVKLLNQVGFDAVETLFYLDLLGRVRYL